MTQILTVSSSCGPPLVSAGLERLVADLHLAVKTGDQVITRTIAVSQPL